MLIIDDDVGGIGSPNVDIRSFFLNFELGLFLYDRPQIEALGGHLPGGPESSERSTPPVRAAVRARGACWRTAAGSLSPS